jgi:hypothetical protein
MLVIIYASFFVGIMKEEATGDLIGMRKVWGFACFFFGLGIFAGMLLAEAFWGIVLGCGCLLLGYHLFCCE